MLIIYIGLCNTDFSLLANYHLKKTEKMNDLIIQNRQVNISRMVDF